MLELQPPVDQLVTLVGEIKDHQLDGPTPCPDISVAKMLGHLDGLSIAFRDAAAKIDGPTTSTAPTPGELELPTDWRSVIPRHLAELVAAWRQPAAWDGLTRVGGVQLPGSIAGQVANNELVLHGWDLAVATGQPFEVAPVNLESSWEMVSNTPDTPEARTGLFGPVVPVSEDAPLLDQVLAHAGRAPHWSP